MLLAVDVAAGAVLHGRQAAALLGGDGAVGLGLGFGLVDVGLFLFEALGFLRRQAAAGRALGDDLLREVARGGGGGAEFATGGGGGGADVDFILFLSSLAKSIGPREAKEKILKLRTNYLFCPPT